VKGEEKFLRNAGGWVFYWRLFKKETGIWRGGEDYVRGGCGYEEEGSGGAAGNELSLDQFFKDFSKP